MRKRERTIGAGERKRAAIESLAGVKGKKKNPELATMRSLGWGGTRQLKNKKKKNPREVLQFVCKKSRVLRSSGGRDIPPL